MEVSEPIRYEVHSKWGAVEARSWVHEDGERLCGDGHGSKARP